MFQADAFNAFNHANWSNPSTTVTSGGSGFGQIGSANPPRQVQFGAKFGLLDCADTRLLAAESITSCRRVEDIDSDRPTVLNFGSALR